MGKCRSLLGGENSCKPIFIDFFFFPKRVNTIKHNYPGFVGYLAWNINITLAAFHSNLSLHPLVSLSKEGRTNQTAPARKSAQNSAAWLLLTTQRTGVTHIYGLDFKPISLHFIYEPITCFILTVPPGCSRSLPAINCSQWDVEFIIWCVGTENPTSWWAMDNLFIGF